MASPKENSEATALPQVGLSAVCRRPNVSQNVQYVCPEGGYEQAAARATSPSPRLHAPPGSPVPSTESGTGLQNVDDPGFSFGPLSTFPFDALNIPPDGQPGIEDDLSMFNLSDSLRIGPKGESSFSYLSNFSESATSMAGSSLLGLQSYYEGEYSATEDFRSSIPEIPPPPSASLSLPASLQTLTLQGITENEDEFKIVDEIWDENTNRYNIVKSPESPYPFVVNRRFGKPNTKPKSSITIKSEGLPAIVLQALEGSNNALACSIGEEDITVDLDVLLNCLPQLEDRLAIYTGFTLAPPTNRTDASGEHLKRLVKFLKLLQEIDMPPTPHTVQVGGELEI